MSPRRPSPGHRELKTAIEELKELYAHLPTLSCLGLCEASCGEHIDASTAERARLLEAGVDLNAPNARWGVPGADPDVRGREVQRARHPPHHLPVVGRDGLDALPPRLPT